MKIFSLYMFSFVVMLFSTLNTAVAQSDCNTLKNSYLNAKSEYERAKTVPYDPSNPGFLNSYANKYLAASNAFMSKYPTGGCQPKQKKDGGSAGSTGKTGTEKEKTTPPKDPGEGDDDLDGVINRNDNCNFTPPGAVVDQWGCELVIDDDKDGVYNQNDKCKNTPPGVQVDQKGCAIENVLIVKLRPLQPNNAFYLEKKNARLNITVDVRVIAYRKDLRGVYVEYNGPPMQSDVVNMPKSGGSGLATMEITGPERYGKDVTAKLIITAEFESGASITKSIDVTVKLSSPNLNQLKKLHQIQTQTMNTVRQKVQKAQAVSAPAIPALQEIDGFIKESENTIQEIDQTLNAFEGGSSQTPVSASTEPSTEEVIQGITNDNSKASEEIREWKDWLQPLIDHIDPLREPLIEALKWIDLDGITTIKTPPEKYQVIQSERDNVFLVVNGNAEIVKQIDKRGTIAKVKDGTFLYLKDMLDPVKSAKDLYYTLSDSFTIVKLVVMGNEKEWDQYLENTAAEEMKRERETDPGWKPLIIEGQHVVASSQNTAYEFAVDPDTGLDLIRTYHGSVTVHSKNGQFEDQVLESKTVMTIDHYGIVSKERESNHQLVSHIERYESALGSANITIQEANSHPNADFSFMPSAPQPGDDVVFVSTSSDPDGDELQYTWYFGEDHIQYLDGLSNWQYTYEKLVNRPVRLVVNDGRGGVDEFTYTVEAVESAGEVAIAPEEVDRVEPDASQVAEFDFTYMPKEPREGDPIVLVNLSTNPNGEDITYLWFVDGKHLPERDNQMSWELEGLSKGSHLIQMDVRPASGEGGVYFIDIEVK